VVKTVDGVDTKGFGINIQEGVRGGKTEGAGGSAHLRRRKRIGDKLPHGRMKLEGEHIGD